MSSIPNVKCLGCDRVAPCMRMKDGTVYKPFAWQYPNDSDPMRGVCGDCQTKAQAAAFVARVGACKTVEEYHGILREVGLDPAGSGIQPTPNRSKE